jgi:phenylacetate-CoA ligase
MHVTAEDVMLEILDARGRPCEPGQAGEVVVTHLATGDFPFIRYRTGDVATLDPAPCGCGRGLPRLREVHGRTTDFVVAADGTVMHGLALIYVVRDLPSVGQFKIVQESLRHTRVVLVPGPGYGPEAEQAICQGMRERLGGRVRVEIETVEQIPPERSGKFRYVVSKVASDASGFRD